MFCPRARDANQKCMRARFDIVYHNTVAAETRAQVLDGAKKNAKRIFFSHDTRRETRTLNLFVRSEKLYPIELGGRTIIIQ